MNTAKAITILSLLCLASGCGTLHQKLQGSRFDTPETNGTQRRFKVHLDAAQATDVTIVPSSTDRPPDFNHPSADDATAIGLDASFGLADRLDLGLKLNEPSMFTAKLQLLGPSANEAQEGDASLAIMIGAGSGSMTDSGSQSTIGSGSFAWRGSLKTRALDVAVIAGVRASSRLLIYGGGFYTNYTFDTRIDQDASYDSSLAPASFSQTTSGYQRGANLGAQIFFGASPVYLIVEGVYADVRTGNLQHTLVKAGYAFGASF